MSTQIGVSGVTFSDSTVQHTASSITQTFLAGPFSNTYLDFQNLSPYVKKITVMFHQVSTSGTSPIIIRVGSFYSGIVTSGYSSMGSTNWTTLAQTTGLLTMQANNSVLWNSGVYTLAIVNGATMAYAWSGTMAQGQSYIGTGQGAISLGNPVYYLRITTLNGTDLIQNGYVNIIQHCA